MTRFFITLDKATDFVLSCFKIMNGGEIFIPKMPSIKIMDLAKVMKKDYQKIKITGIRAGEKLHEVLNSGFSNQDILEAKNFYIINPEIKFYLSKFINKENKNLKKIRNFQYSSNQNNFLNYKQIKNLLKT